MFSRLFVASGEDTRFELPAQIHRSLEQGEKKKTRNNLEEQRNNCVLLMSHSLGDVTTGILPENTLCLKVTESYRSKGSIH